MLKTTHCTIPLFSKSKSTNSSFFLDKKRTLLTKVEWEKFENSTVMSCFPGDKKSLQIAISDAKLKHNLIVDNPISAIDFFIKNNLLKKQQIIDWRKNLQTNDKEGKFNNIIGRLALASETNHIVLSPDGSRRWAAKQGFNVSEGHRAFFQETLPSILEDTYCYGVHTISVGCVSVSNLLTREIPQLIDFLLHFEQAIDIYFNIAKTLQIKISSIGSEDIHSDMNVKVRASMERLQKKLALIECDTQHFTRHRLNLLVNHDGITSIVRTIKNMHKANVDFSQLRIEDILKYTDMSDQLYPIPDIFIRTASPVSGGRIGGVFPLEMAMTHNVFVPTLAPELSMDIIFDAAASFIHPLATYRSRQYPSTPPIEQMVSEKKDLSQSPIISLEL